MNEGIKVALTLVMFWTIPLLPMIYAGIMAGIEALKQRAHAGDREPRVPKPNSSSVSTRLAFAGREFAPNAPLAQSAD